MVEKPVSREVDDLFRTVTTGQRNWRLSVTYFVNMDEAALLVIQANPLAPESGLALTNALGLIEDI